MPACYRVDIAQAHMYFDKNRSRCNAPGSRPVGLRNTIYFLRTSTPFPLLHPAWDAGLQNFSDVERQCGCEWVKDEAYETGADKVIAVPAIPAALAGE